MEKLAIEGGTPVFTEPLKLPKWPPRYPETAERLKEIYLNETWSFYGPRETAFNNMFAAFNGVRHCVMMANGTVTLEMALYALGVGAGDEVIVPAHTWLATGEAVAYRGAIPVIVDIEADTLCMAPAAFEAAITPKTKAVIPVHLFGSIADMDRILDIAKRHNIAVIEDCAHVHGSEWDGKKIGSMGAIGSFSFQQSKLLASGEGGACITNDDDLAEILGRVSHIGYPFGAKQGEKSGEPPEKGLICHNYRVTDFQAEILISQLEHFDADNAQRAKAAEYLRRNLNAIDGIKVQAPGRKATLQTYYNYCMKLDQSVLKPGITRKEFLEAIRAEGVEAGTGWGDVMYKHRLWTILPKDFRIESCENAERIVYSELIALNHEFLMLPQGQLAKIVEAFQKVMNAYHA